MVRRLGLLLLAFGCGAGPVDEGYTPEDLLVELAQGDGKMMARLPALIEALEGVEITSPEVEGELWSGTLQISDEVAANYGGPGALSFEGNVAYTFDELSYEKHWEWHLSVDYGDLELTAGTLNGAATWDVSVREIEIGFQAHTFSGEFQLNDSPRLAPVVYDSLFSGNLHRVSGSIDMQEVNWVNESPDNP
jgi:hypothetical protein